MAEYIECEYVIKCMEDSYKNAGISAEAKAKMMRWLNKAPAADVRPVVFCKDCKYAERVGMADCCVWCNENLLSRLDEDFCSRGAKMEES